MKPMRPLGARLSLVAVVSGLMLIAAAAQGQSNDQIRVVNIQGVVEVSTDGGIRWVKTTTSQPLRAGDHLRTLRNTRAALQWSDSSVVPCGPLTEIEVLPPHAPQALAGLRLFKGILSFFHRDRPGRIRVITRGAVAGIEGTEFVIAVDAATERTTLSVIDGLVSFSNEVSTLTLTNGQQAVATPGSAPQRIAGFVAHNLLQWAFYYPAVLDLRDMPFSRDEEQALAESLAAYRAGDLLDALAKYGNRQPASETERIYQAALLLAVGEVGQTSNALVQIEQANNSSERVQRLAAALRQQIAAVKRDATATTREPELATELLAASYYEQSRAGGDKTLKRALDLAKQAATTSPEFGFAWERVAELEFSFGRTDKASEALNKSLALSPRNAQALALQGFLFAAQNKPREAIEWFDRALAVDSALGNAWLGRGLCRIRRGDRAGGREDLLIAAALEPQRAALRNYLGKAYAESNDRDRALHELELAKQLDPNDPTAWLYSALVKAEHSRINEGIRDLEKSQELNDNRRLYRSRFLLDQDRAVRSVNLARLYADSDLGDVAVREAGRAVSLDYANYSAHVFLANSYEVERRANLSNLRFEAASFGEYLLANLLGPANGRLLAQPVTQLEYSTLFERNRLGVIANTEYFGRGAWHHSSAQYGTLNGSGYSLEAEYRTEPGERDNQDFEIRQLEAKFKHDITPEDSVYLHVVDYRAEGGDAGQHFDEREIARTFRFQQEQVPNVLAGYHHQWSPQNHTLFLAGRFDETLDSADPNSVVRGADRTPGTVISIVPVDVGHTYRSRVELYSAEAQQIVVVGRHSLIAGARGQWSKQKVTDRVENPFGPFSYLLGLQNPVAAQDEEVTSSTAAIYAYDYVRVTDTLQVVGGLNYAYQVIPVNTATTPVSSKRDHQQQINPKAGIIWSPAPWSSVRASYTRSLIGAGLGQSVRLEPIHVAGLLQTFRDPVPPSLAGQLDGADLETSELLWEGRFDKTYLSLGGQRLVAERNRRLGLFVADDPDFVAAPSLGLIRERVRFREHAVDLSAHQLVSEEWSFGLRYRLGHAQLKRGFPEYPGLGRGGIDDRTDWRGWLHTVSLSGLYRHHSGVFARAEGVVFAQDREREGTGVPEDNFWKVDIMAGYRFPTQHAEIAVGVLNVLDNDYHLDPLNQHADQPRSRTFYARLLLNF